jgi:high-affinity nickel-transport protein
VRKLFYNIVITGLSAAVALMIGTIEFTGLIAHKLNAHGPFWAWLENININALGIIIVAMFVATWAIALAIWRIGRIEERWGGPVERRAVG